MFIAREMIEKICTTNDPDGVRCL